MSARGHPARQLYDDRTAYASAGIDKVLADLGLEGQALEAEHRAWAGTLTDLAVPANEAKTLLELAVVQAYPDEATSGTWRTESVQLLKDTYGHQWRSTLADAQLLLQRDPRLKAWLDETGLGDHPRFIAMAADRARALASTGFRNRD